jgi:hypothetical protein
METRLVTTVTTICTTVMRHVTTVTTIHTTVMRLVTTVTTIYTMVMRLVTTVTTIHNTGYASRYHGYHNMYIGYAFTAVTIPILLSWRKELCLDFEIINKETCLK